MKQKTLKCPEAASVVPEKQLLDCTGLWSEPFSPSQFVTAESVTELGIADHSKAPAHCNFQLKSTNQPVFLFNSHSTS